MNTALPRFEQRPLTSTFFIQAIWFGGVSGLVEGFLYWLFIRQNWLSLNEAILSVGPEQIWVSALFNIVLFAGMALALSVIARVAPWSAWPSIGFSVFTFLLILDWADFSRRISTSAALILAIGFTVQAWRRYSLDPKAWEKRIAKTAPAVCLLVILAFAGISGGKLVLEWWQVAHLPAALPGAPNVLLIVADTLRADHLSSYGYSRPTSPSIDHLASEGVLFEKVYSTSSWTLPSHASIFTGRYVFEHLADGRMTGRMLDARFPTLAEVLSGMGYRTGAFTANLAWTPPKTHLDRGFHRYNALYRSPSEFVARSFYGRLIRKYLDKWELMEIPRPVRQSTSVNAEFLSWIGVKKDRPFFAFLNYMDVHEPRQSMPPFDTRFRGAVQPKDGFDAIRTWGLSDEEAAQRETWNASYDNAISSMDEQIRGLRQTLQEKGLLENTLVIFTADHGEMIGEHRLFDHGNSLYLPVVHVPLIVWFPKRIPEGRRVATPVSQLDLAATVLNLLSRSGTQLVGGTSLERFWKEGDPASNDPVLTEVDKANIDGIPANWPVRKGWLKSLITSNWQFILNEDGTRELYDLNADPQQTQNLITMPEAARVAESLEQELRKRVPETSSVPASRATKADD